jgi:N-acetylmuramate 1-kinase
VTNLSENEPFFGFLTKTLGRREIQVFNLAGDASARRYYRISTGDDSYVLMSWEPFQDEKSYPFLNVRQHFEKNGVAVPKVVGESKSRRGARSL